MRRLFMKMQLSRMVALRFLALGFLIVGLPLILAFHYLKLWHVDLSVPLTYNNGDATWQFVLSKALYDTGWILVNPFLGAPGVALWHANAAAQTSALHSVLMWCLIPWVPDAIFMQQIYYIINFPLITFTTYIACRIFRIDRWLACFIGLIFAFTNFRLNLMIYSYIPNYFIIPLAMVPVLWIMTGHFGALAFKSGAPFGLRGEARRLLSSRAFWFSCVVIALTAITDGYYAFFTLLLLGFAGGVRLVAPAGGRLTGLVVPLVLAGVLLAVAFTLTWPLRAYRRSHAAEFLLNGSPDPSMIKHPFEAEVYSSSLKLMLAPIPNHNIPMLAKFGAWIIETSKQARIFPTDFSVSFGSLGAILLICMFVFIIAKSAFNIRLPLRRSAEAEVSVFGASIALGLFIFLCSIAGGIGTLIALIYPEIRAYSRFPLFLFFILYFSAGVFATSAMQPLRTPWRRLCVGIAFGVTLLVIWDQMPDDVGQRSPAVKTRFLAESDFVRTMEASLPAGAMVYQYPFSQYLTNSRYYGWGAFAQVRLYLHSQHLRWSNGASKNSPIDNWHTRLAQLPIEQLVTEVRAAGFQGFVVDRTVVPDAEYATMRDALIKQTGVSPVEDAVSQLAYWRLPELGYRLVYDESYTNPTAIIVSEPKIVDQSNLSRLIDAGAFDKLLARGGAGGLFVVQKTIHPEVFRDAAVVDIGLGEVPIPSIQGMRGDVLCPQNETAPLSVQRDGLAVTVKNRSDFDWRLNSGAFPIRIGMRELLGPDGSRLRWDGGFRAPGTPYIAEGHSIEMRFPLAGLDLTTGVPDNLHEVTAIFGLVQEGNAWFGSAMGDGECRVTLTR